MLINDGGSILSLDLFGIFEISHKQRSVTFSLPSEMAVDTQDIQPLQHSTIPTFEYGVPDLFLYSRESPMAIKLQESTAPGWAIDFGHSSQRLNE